MSDVRLTHGRRFSATEAAFAGFRLLRREPVVGLTWAGLMLALGLAFGAVTVVAVGPVLAEMAAAGAQPDPAVQMRLVGRLLPLYALSFPLALALYGVFYAAVNRAILRPQDKGFAYLRLGADELKQVGVLFLYGLVVFAVYLVTIILMVVLGVAVGVGAAATGSGSPGPAAVGVVIALVLLGLAMFGAVLFVGVRLSLCTAITFDTGIVDLFGSWRMTRKRFWPLFGAFLLAWLVSVALWLVLALLFGVIAAATGGGLQAAGTIFAPRTDSLAAYFAPTQLVWLALSSGMSAVFVAVLIGVSADAYAQIRAETTPEAVF